MSKLTVIFDMDGVILDSERVYQEIERSMYEKLGIPVSREEHMKFMGTAERSMWDFMCKKYKLNRSVEDLVLEERQRLIDRLEAPVSIPLMEGLIPLLETLRSKHIPCWIASSSSSDIISRVIRINGLQQYYQGYVSGDDVSQSKPSPEIFLKAATLAGADPADCLVFEDSLNGVRAAKAAGMRVLALRNPGSEQTDFSEADEVVIGLTGIISLIL